MSVNAASSLSSSALYAARFALYSPRFRVGLAERGGYLLADERGVARACPDVLVVLGLVAVVVALMGVPGLHALHRLLLEQLDAVHERHGAHALADALQHVRHPGVALAADVDENVRVLYLEYVLRRRLIGVRLAARRAAASLTEPQSPTSCRAKS